MSLFPLGLISQGGGAGGAAAFELISTQLGSGTAITFSSIASTWKHLQLRVVTQASSGGGGIYLRMNSDTGTNYSYHRLYARDGTGSYSYGVGGANLIHLTPYYWGTSTTIPAVEIVDILDYADTNKNKTVRIMHGQVGSSANEIGLLSGAWFNTAAVTSLTISGSFDSTSRFSLYGVRGS